MGEKLSVRRTMRNALLAAVAATSVPHEAVADDPRSLIRPSITDDAVTGSKRARAKEARVKKPAESKNKQAVQLPSAIDPDTIGEYVALSARIRNVRVALGGLEVTQEGYEAFCRELEILCERFAHYRNDAIRQTRFSLETISLITRIHRDVNTKIRPQSDLDQYGVVEKWTIPADAGDCEDYVLLKMVHLLNAGFAASQLHILVVLDQKGEGHAVLGVDVLEKGLWNTLVLDNLHANILTLDEMESVYRGMKVSFVTKRQGKFNVRFYDYRSRKGS